MEGMKDDRLKKLRIAKNQLKNSLYLESKAWSFETYITE